MRQWMRLALLGLFAGTLLGCVHDDDDDDTTFTSGSGSNSAAETQLRVLHAAADAPPVDVLVDDEAVLSNVAYRQGSGYLTVDAGERNVKVNPTGEQTSVIEASPTLAENTANSLLVLGKVGDQTIEPLLLEDDTSPPDTGNVKLRVVHGAPDAGAVDVYVTEPGIGLTETTPTLSNVAYKDASEFLEVPAGVYQVRIAPAGETPAVYDSGPVTLQEGSVLTTVAIPTPNAQTIGLVGLSDDEQNPVFQLANVQETRIRALHAVPNAPAVDVLVDGDVVLSDLSYKEASGYLNVANGDRQIQVNPTTTTDSVINATGTFEQGLPYTVIALGNLAADGTGVDPLIVEDETVGASAQDARVRVIHAAADVTAVDAYVTAPDTEIANATPAVSGVSFQDVSPYLTLQPGEYRIRITPAADPQTVVYDSGQLTLNAGEIVTAVAVPATGGSSPVSLVALTNSPTQANFEIPDIHAEIRAVHASPDAPAVDVLVDDQVVFSNLNFKDVSEYAQVTATDGPTISVNPTGTGTSVLETSPALERGTDYTLMAVNFLADIEPLLLTDDQTPPHPGNAKVRLVHASPDAPAVDILVDDEVAVSDVSFTESSDYLQLPAGEHTVAIRAAGTGTTVAKTTVNVEAGKIYTVAAVNQLAGLETLVITDN